MKLDQIQLTNIFQEAKARYPNLEHTNINLTFKKGWFFTMQAKVNIFSICKKKRKYIINVNPRKGSILSKLSEDDILAWFGHELAHIVDYETMSWAELLVFTFRYIFDLKFRFSVERRINAYTCNNGFARELLYAWKKFTIMDGVNKRYKNYIIKNYSPSWEDIRSTAEQEGITEEMYKSLIGI